MLVIPIVIILKLTGEHYIFYYQQRVGRFGNEFKMIKFSTMLLNSPNLGPGEITVKNDLRVFPFGRFLRKSKINELPQILNIFKGDMSIVGPRPLTPKHFGFYSAEQQEIIKQLKPGLTGLASIVFREEEEIFAKSNMGLEETYRQLLSPYKASLEEWYLQNQSFWVDLKIILLTVFVILLPNSRLQFKWLKGLPDYPADLKTLLYD